MKKLRTVLIGCGRIAGLHAKGYKRNLDRFEVVGLSDLKLEAAEAFAKEHEFDARLYTDYRDMLKELKPDVASICLWTGLHKEVIAGCIECGVKIIHSEKPMAPTYGDALAIVALAEKHDVQLTFNHQRRMLPVFRKACELIKSGAIGELRSVEAYIPQNILDWGTHVIDLIFAMNSEVPAKWTMGQIDARECGEWFGIPFEFHAIGQIMFENDVWAFVQAGKEKERNFAYRVYGTEGELDIQEEEPILQARLKGESQLSTVSVEGDLHNADDDHIAAVMAQIADCAESGKESELSYQHAIKTTEVIFAWFESSRSRARIDLPLQTRDSALLTMLDEGVL